MDSPGGNSGSENTGIQGGSGDLPGAIQVDTGSPTSVSASANVATYTTAITTTNTTPTSQTQSDTDTTSIPSSSTTDTGRNSRAIIIGGAIGGALSLLFIIFLITWCCNRRSKSKEKNKHSAAKENGTLPNSPIVPVTNSEPNREFADLPFRQPENRWNHPNPDGSLPQAAINNAVAAAAGSRRPSISSRRSARRNSRNSINRTLSGRNRDRGSIEGGDNTSPPIDREGLLPPTYEESQSDALSMRVLTPQYPQPSAFLDSSATRAAGFLSPRGFESPYTSQIYSPSSLQTDFYDLYHNAPYEDDDDDDAMNRRTLRRETIEQDNDPPLSPLELPPQLHHDEVMNDRAGAVTPEQLRAAMDSLENLVRGPGGLLGRSASGRTVTSISTVSVFSDGDLREMPVDRGMR